MRRLILFSFILSMLGVLPAFAQDASFSDVAPMSENIDSLIADSIRKAFILNHRPLSSTELNGIALDRVSGFYGSYATKYMQKQNFYDVNAPAMPQFISKRNTPHLEWMFYCFALLFLFLGLINAFFSNYLKKLFRVFINEGFVYRQAKDQMTQAPVAAFLLNFLFVLSGTVFIYFGLNISDFFSGMDRWQLMLMIFSFLLLVYVFKYIFLKCMGWVFNQGETLENYVFIVFLNNKISGMVMLLASFMMAFSEHAIGMLVFKSSLYVLAALMLIRFIRGFLVFSKQAKMDFFGFLIAVLGLELLPTAVMVKFISSGIQLAADGLL